MVGAMNKEPHDRDLQDERTSRARSREDHLSAGRQLTIDESKARADHRETEPTEITTWHGEVIDNEDVSELSENDSSGG